MSSINIDTSGIISNGSISNTVLNSPIESYTDSLTLGGFIKNKLLTVSKFIGLQ